MKDAENEWSGEGGRKVGGERGGRERERERWSVRMSQCLNKKYTPLGQNRPTGYHHSCV